MRFEDTELQHLLVRVQDGVVARRQLIELGASGADILRMLRRRELTRVVPGVLVNHTGPLTHPQREWVAVLSCAPAALGFESALGLPTPDGRIRVVTGPARRLRPLPGVRIQPVRAFVERIDPMSCPPRIRFPDAAIDTAAERGTSGAFTLLAEVLHSRRTTPAGLRDALAARARVPRRSVLEGLIDDLAAGTCSVLERGYLHLVERPHGLPPMKRQSADLIAGRRIYRDGDYSAYGVVVELDGLAFHDGPRVRALDSMRDLETVAASERTTLRITYRQVFDEGCHTAALIGRILRRRGWRGTPKRCPHCR